MVYDVALMVADVGVYQVANVFDPKYNCFMFGPEKQSMLFSTKAFHGE